MARPSPRTYKLIGQHASEHARPVPDPERITELRRAIRASRARDYIEELLDGSPPLTQQQLNALAGLLTGPHGEILDASGLEDAGYGGGHDPEPDLILLARARRLLKDGGARRIRERAGIKRAVLAAAAGITVPTLARWEAAARVPSGEHAVQYARALAELAELVGVGGEPDAT